MSIAHNVPLKIQTASSNCVQTATSQLLTFYDLDVSAGAIEEAVPVRKNAANKPMGTLLADIGRWLSVSEGFRATMYVFDVQIIDRSWAKLPQQDIRNEIQKLVETGVSTAKTPYAPILIEAYDAFLQAGGEVNVAKCTNTLLRSLLEKGPVLAIVSFNYLYDYPRSAYNAQTKNYEPNYADGKAIEHAIVITGYKDNAYYYNDPDQEYGGQHQVDDDILIGAICTAQLNSDNYLLALREG